MNGLSPWFWRYGTRQPQAPPVVPTQAPALEGKYGDIHFRREDIDNDVATVFGIEVFRVRRQGETYLVRTCRKRTTHMPGASRSLPGKPAAGEGV